MNNRILFAGILGGVVLFIWNFVAHDMLPLGEMGIKIPMPNEDAITSAIQTGLGENSGVYYFPTGGLSQGATKEQKQEAMKKAVDQMASGASGFLIYRPKRVFNIFRKLFIQFGTDVACALLVAFLLAKSSIASFGGRVGFVVIAGLLAAITTNIPYANWYGFPKDFTLAQIIMQVVGFLLVGIVAAMLIRPKTAAPA